MVVLLTIIHILICLFLIVVVLLQSGKAADLAGAFGGMGSQTAFGPRGTATALSKATTLAAAAFMVTSMALAVLTIRTAGTSHSVLDSSKKSAPAQPGQGANPNKPISVTVKPEGGKAGPAQTIPLPLPSSGKPAAPPAAAPAKK